MPKEGGSVWSFHLAQGGEQEDDHLALDINVGLDNNLEIKYEAGGKWIALNLRMCSAG